jgi:hemerythrin-like domain-containing protein
MAAKPIQILEDEHEVIERVVASVALVLDRLEAGHEATREELHEIVEFLSVFGDQCHHSKEDDYLFPLLVTRGVPARGCPLGALQKEHEKGRALVSQLSDAVDAYTSSGGQRREALIETLRALVELYPNHIWKERYLLFPLTEKILSPEDQERLSQEFEKVESRIGPDVHRRFEGLASKLSREAESGPQRAPAPVTGLLFEFDLQAEIKRLKGEDAFRSGRNARTILKEPDFRIVLTSCVSACECASITAPAGSRCRLCRGTSACICPIARSICRRAA